MKILNLHGFMGEADNKNYKTLCEIFSAYDIISPKVFYKETSPEEILRQLSEMVDSDDFIFVGQSLGGWYADKLSRKFARPCILTNPCYPAYLMNLRNSTGDLLLKTGISVHIRYAVMMTLFCPTITLIV